MHIESDPESGRGSKQICLRYVKRFNTLTKWRTEYHIFYPKGVSCLLNARNCISSIIFHSINQNQKRTFWLKTFCKHEFRFNKFSVSRNQAEPEPFTSLNMCLSGESHIDFVTLSVVPTLTPLELASVLKIHELDSWWAALLHRVAQISCLSFDSD